MSDCNGFLTVLQCSFAMIETTQVFWIREGFRTVCVLLMMIVNECKRFQSLLMKCDPKNLKNVCEC